VSSTIDPPILSIVLREPSCLDEIKPPLDANEALVEPNHTMFETHEIGAQPNQLIYRRHASRKVMKAAQDRVELCIDLPKHSPRQIFELVNHIRPQ
jgi:hypothetical protein